MSWTFVNTGFFNDSEAVLQANDLALQRGYGVFDFLRTANNQPLFMNDYLDRFFNSALQLFITIPYKKEEVKQYILELIVKNNIPESGIRMLATGGYSPDGYSPVTGNFILQQQALQTPDKEKFQQGIKIITHPYQRDFPAVKSTNYLMGVWLQHQLKEKSIDAVLYFHNDIVSEFPRANVFIITAGGRLVTPAANILQGITRKKVLELAPEILPAEQRHVSIAELKNAAEVFMTSTTRRILPVVEIDGIKIGNGRAGKITTQLYERFLELEAEVLRD